MIKNKIYVLNHAGQGFWAMTPLLLATAPGSEDMGLERGLLSVAVSSGRCRGRFLFSFFPCCKVLRIHAAVRAGLSTSGSATPKNSLVSWLREAVHDERRQVEEIPAAIVVPRRAIQLVRKWVVAVEGGSWRCGLSRTRQQPWGCNQDLPFPRVTQARC